MTTSNQTPTPSPRASVRPILAVALGAAALVVLAVALGVWQYQSTARANSTAVLRADPDRADHGQQLFMRSCATCHGANAQGLPHQGVDLRDSAFVARHSDQELIRFLREGRAANDPRNKTGLNMPPRGGNAGFTDQDLSDIVAHLRRIQKPGPAGDTATADVSMGETPVGK